MYILCTNTCTCTYLVLANTVSRRTLWTLPGGHQKLGCRRLQGVAVGHDPEPTELHQLTGASVHHRLQHCTNLCMYMYVCTVGAIPVYVYTCTCICIRNFLMLIMHVYTCIAPTTSYIDTLY